MGKNREKRVLVPVALVEFLNGEAPLGGVWYGEDAPKGKPKFWWRGYFAARRQRGQKK